ncbi:hypothetical protein MTR67_001770 [Solanum verrucosum]|uniref:Uncharacterized protein n=1 Tax=Solanum verrucosum TaxID=315347 RepID=A0AAF0PSG0_SOLVR|nr:hypothetical protein MTR67_001770 [Solanum verrucosum]
MLRILLNKQANESGGVVQRLPLETVKVACPDHFVLADLPVAKSLGSVNPASLLKTVGRRSLRRPDPIGHYVCSVQWRNQHLRQFEINLGNPASEVI